jgi:hypothetical protein
VAQPNVSLLENVALVTAKKSATFRDIRDIWSTPFFARSENVYLLLNHEKTKNLGIFRWI